MRQEIMVSEAAQNIASRAAQSSAATSRAGVVAAIGEAPDAERRTLQKRATCKRPSTPSTGAPLLPYGPYLVLR